MKKAAVILFLFVGIVRADYSPAVETRSGLYWYPYSSRYYPGSYRYYAPWHYRTEPHTALSPYRYPGDTGWHGYSEYPWYYPYGGLYFYNGSVILNPGAKKTLKLPESDHHPPLPGSAPLSLRSKKDTSIQSERVKEFLSPDTNTAHSARERHNDQKDKKEQSKN